MSTMRWSVYLVVPAVIWSFMHAPAAGAGSSILLEGRYVGPTQANPLPARDIEKGIGEDGEIIQTGPLPFIEERLAQAVAGIEPDEPVRVIIFLKYQPHNLIAAEVKARYALRRQNIDTRIKTILETNAARRDVNAAADSENYNPALRSIHEEHEACYWP